MSTTTQTDAKKNKKKTKCLTKVLLFSTSSMNLGINSTNVSELFRSDGTQFSRKIFPFGVLMMVVEGMV